MQFNIRPYHPADLISYYSICLKTGDSGKDATGMYKDPDLIGHFYAAPYAVIEPDVCFTLTCDGVPCGYIIGTKDSEKFSKCCEIEWFPELRERYILPHEDDESLDAGIVRLIHKGQIVKDEVKEYPAHLHIDLLPVAQGQGLGRKIITTFTDNLKQLNVPALHLEVGKKNEGAVAFYERVGFHRIEEYEYSIAFGMQRRYRCDSHSYHRTHTGSNHQQQCSGIVRRGYPGRYGNQHYCKSNRYGDI